MQLNLKIIEHAYIFGLFQSDGHLEKVKGKNKGRLTIELNELDKEIIFKIQKLFDCNSNIRFRKRKTNFKNEINTCSLTIYDQEVINQFNIMGMPYGKKSEIITIPKVDYCERDYWRGIIDGDGSLGMTSNGFPFFSLVTSSEELKDAFLELIYKITNKVKNIKRNERDNIFNIVIFKEDAQKLTKYIYYNGCLGLERKIKASKEVVKWKRPLSMKKINFQRNRWTNVEDEFILNHSVEESMKKLSRTMKSIKIRIYRLQKGVVCSK